MAAAAENSTYQLKCEWQAERQAQAVYCGWTGTQFTAVCRTSCRNTKEELGECPAGTERSGPTVCGGEDPKMSSYGSFSSQADCESHLGQYPSEYAAWCGGEAVSHGSCKTAETYTGNCVKKEPPKCPT